MATVTDLRAHREALAAQRASGVAQVGYDGKTVDYCSVAEIDRAIEVLDRAIAAAKGRRIVRQVTTVPIFLLVPQVKLPKRLDLARDTERVHDAVPELVVANCLERNACQRWHWLWSITLQECRRSRSQATSRSVLGCDSRLERVSTQASTLARNILFALR